MYSQTASSKQESRPFPGLAAFGGVCSAPQQSGRVILPLGLSKSLRAGRGLFSEGQAAERIYEVVDGMLGLYKLLPDGRRQITGFALPGQLMGLAHGGTYLYSVEAITDTSLLAYPRARVERLVEETPALARRLLSMTYHELHIAQDRMLLLGRKHAVEKVASFLLEMAGRQDSQHGVHIPMGRGDIADYLGLTKETVCKLLSQLRREGVIAASSVSHIVICDRGHLEELAAGELADAFRAA